MHGSYPVNMKRVKTFKTRLLDVYHVFTCKKMVKTFVVYWVPCHPVRLHDFKTSVDFTQRND